MGRTLIAGLVGGVVFFIWGMLAWMVLPLHMMAMSGTPNEAQVTAALKSANLESGVYAAPWSDVEADWSDPESDLSKRHLAGPLYTIFYHREGGSPMPLNLMAGGLLIDVLGGIVAALLLSASLGCCRSYWQRVGFVTALGLFVAIIAHLSYWNWMHFSASWTLAFVVDCVVGWGLAGAAMAAIIKPRAGSSSGSVAA